MKFCTQGTPSTVPNFTPSVQQQGYTTPKLKFLLTFDQNVKYKRPAGAYPFRNFHKICTVCTLFQDASAAKISLDMLKGLWSYPRFKLRGSGYSQIFSAPYQQNYVSDPKVLEVQKCARGPLSLCEVCLGPDFTCCRAAKNVEFFLVGGSSRF